MGSTQSYIPAVVAVVAVAAYGYLQVTKPTVVSEPPVPSTSSKKHKKKREAAKEDAVVEPSVVSFPPVIPGDFDIPTQPEPNVARTKPKKKKTKKASTPVPNDAQSESSATAPESSTARKPKKAAAAKPPALDDNGWTKVETRKRATQKGDRSTGGDQEGRPLEISTSDAGITTSVGTGNSSPVTERTEDESHMSTSYAGDNRRTLAEKMLPKPRKTGVEDLLEEPDYPQLSRVMRIKPKPDEQPAAGFSWGDYEDVDDAKVTADDADGEDDGEWGVVKSRGRRTRTTTQSQVTPTAQKAPETLTKKQRQRAARNEVQKAVKAEAEAERLATLAQHRRELDRIRMAEQTSKSPKTSGGMSASVDENGKLVWQ